MHTTRRDRIIRALLYTRRMHASRKCLVRETRSRDPRQLNDG